MNLLAKHAASNFYLEDGGSASVEDVGTCVSDCTASRSTRRQCSELPQSSSVTTTHNDGAFCDTLYTVWTLWRRALLFCWANQDLLLAI